MTRAWQKDSFNPLSFQIDVDKDEETIIMRELDYLREDMVTRYIHLKDQAVREKLIELGWTPPND